jgi:type IV pilus assembly protein PilE
MRCLRFTAKGRVRTSGFSLIELMITVAIIGILVSIALPSYSRYIARAHRADARVQLVQASQFMQRFYAANDSFKTDRSGNAVLSQMPANLRQSPADATSSALYSLAIPEALLDDMQFTLQMVPLASGAMAGDECGAFTLSSTGVRGVLVGGSAGATSLRDRCWL